MTHALARPWELTVGLCDNFWCSRVGLLEAHYVRGEVAAFLCVGECLELEDEDMDHADEEA